jgi:hypothetical protein
MYRSRIPRNRVAVCGSPLNGKKRLLTALADHWRAQLLTVPAAREGEPTIVMFDATLDRAGLVRFEAMHGIVLSFEEAAEQFFATGVSLVVYVLRAFDSHDVPSEAVREMEERNFAAYYRAAEAHQCTWRDVPWFFVSMRQGPTSVTRWTTSLEPPPLAAGWFDVSTGSDTDVARLARAIEETPHLGDDG